MGNVSLDSAIAAGEGACNRIDYPAAIIIYESALKEFPNEPQLLWRLSRTYVTLGEASKPEKKQESFLKAESYARACIQANERVAKGHTGLAAALGSFALISGNRTMVKFSHEIKRELLRAIELDTSDYVPHSILGSYYRELGNLNWVERQLARLLYGGLPEGGYEDAEAELKKAITLAPTALRNHFELGLLYVQWERRVEAVAEFKLAVTLPVLQASDHERLAKIKEYLAELQQ